MEDYKVAYEQIKEELDTFKVLYDNILEHSTAIENALEETLKDVRRKNFEITSSINYAKRIQDAMQPRIEDNSLFKESFLIFRPRDIVSGDFYWCQCVVEEKTEDEYVIVAAVDCTGHGVPGAFMSMLGNNLLDDIVLNRQILNASDILQNLNERIIQSLRQFEAKNDDGMDLTLTVVNLTQKKVQVVGAKNPILLINPENPKIITDNKSGLKIHDEEKGFYELKGSKSAIGGSDNWDAVYHSYSFDLTRGTKIFLFSDGYQDQFGGPDGRKFMVKKFRNLLFESADKSMFKQKLILEKELDDWMNQKDTIYSQTDDILVIGLTL